MFVAFGYTLLYFIASALVVYFVMLIDEFINPAYKVWNEIRGGNVAVGLTAAGKLLGLAVITTFAILHNDTVFQSMVWTAIGGLLQIAGYYAFEALTPRINVGRELAAGNRAIGLVSMGIAIGQSLIIGACIS